MANGKPGDHWLTDLQHWHVRAFGEPIDNLILEIVELGGEATLTEPPWNERLWKLWPAWGRSGAKDSEIDARVQPLTLLRDELRSHAEECGWGTPSN